MFMRLPVNCYDQAGIVQLTLSLQVGNPRDTWAYMNPCGFINKTQLIGVGQSNNPFHRWELARRCVDAYDPRRTSFGNHAFIISDDLVIDSTYGPHTGTETTQAYVSSAIDNSRPRGTVANIRTSQGITYLVDGAPPAYAAPATEPDPIMDAVDRAMEGGLVPHPPGVRFFNVNLAALGRLLVDEFSVRPKYQSTDIGNFGSETHQRSRYTSLGGRAAAGSEAFTPRGSHPRMSNWPSLKRLVTASAASHMYNVPLAPGPPGWMTIVRSLLPPVAVELRPPGESMRTRLETWNLVTARRTIRVSESSR